MTTPLKRVFEVYVFAFAFFFASRPLSDGDFWFHLKTGEYILKTGLIPRVELFSFTSYGKAWIAHGWLSGTIFYSIYSRIGFNSLIFIFALLAALAFWITYKRSGSHPFIRGFAALLGVWAVIPNLGVRPRVFSLLLASLFLALLTNYAQKGKGRAIWWLVPLMTLWVNLHGGFLIGLALIGITLLGIPLDAWAQWRKLDSIWPRMRTLTLVLLGCLMAAGLNPYGVRMFAVPLDVLSSPIYQEVVVDWLSPNFHQREMFAFSLLALLTISALALSPKRPRPSQLLLFLATLYSSLRTQRNIIIFSLVAVPLFADYFQAWWDSTSFGPRFRESGASGVMTRPFSIVIFALLLLPLLPFAIKLNRTIYIPPRQEATHVPMKAVEHLRERQVTGNTFTAPNIWGGYLIWALPSNPVYIDGRDVYPQQFVREFVEITRGLKDWREPFTRYGVKNAIVRKSSFMARELAESTDWQKVYEDELAVVFTRL